MWNPKPCPVAEEEADEGEEEKEEEEEEEAAAAASPAPANSALRATFDKYDVDRDGMLNQKEVLMMMQDLRFEVDGEYLKGVLQTFGRYDKDKSGAIEWGPEFEALCACATCFRT